MDRILKATELMEQNKVEESLAELTKFYPIANDEEKYTIALFYMEWGFLLEASKVLQTLLESYPDEAEFKILLAETYTELENDEAAIAILDEIGTDDPAYLQALIQLADLYESQGLFEVAEQKLLLAKNKAPNEEVIDLALGELYFSIGEFKKAVLYYEQIKSDQLAHVAIHERLAESLAACGEYEKALDYFSQIDTPSIDILYKHGLTAFQAKRYDIAISLWHKVIEQDPYYQTVYRVLAEAYEKENNIQKAYEMVKEGLKWDDFNKELYYYAGVLSHKLGENVESESLLRQAIALEPDYKQAVLLLIDILKETNAGDQIIELILSIQDTGAEDPIYNWELARAYREEEKYEHALNAYNRAYTNLKYDSDFLKEYGFFLSEEGRMNEALPVLTLYLSHEADDDDTREFVNRLNEQLG